jgi:hypothetical protein
MHMTGKGRLLHELHCNRVGMGASAVVEAGILARSLHSGLLFWRGLRTAVSHPLRIPAR